MAASERGKEGEKKTEKEVEVYTREKIGEKKYAFLIKLKGKLSTLEKQNSKEYDSNKHAGLKNLRQILDGIPAREPEFSHVRYREDVADFNFNRVMQVLKESKDKYPLGLSGLAINALAPHRLFYHTQYQNAEKIATLPIVQQQKVTEKRVPEPTPAKSKEEKKWTESERKSFLEQVEKNRQEQKEKEIARNPELQREQKIQSQLKDLLKAVNQFQNTTTCLALKELLKNIPEIDFARPFMAVAPDGKEFLSPMKQCANTALMLLHAGRLRHTEHPESKQYEFYVKEYKSLDTVVTPEVPHSSPSPKR